MIDSEGIPAIGLPAKKKNVSIRVTPKDNYSEYNPINDEDEAEKLVAEAYERKTTVAGE